MNINPMQLIPQKLINSNPMIKRLVEMVKNGNEKELENFAVNLCNERGINFKEEFPKFMGKYKKQ